jgi:predicted small secreted protein
MKSIYPIMMLALVAFVTTGQTAHAAGVDIKNGTLVPDNNPPGVTNETSSNNIMGVIRLQNGPIEMMC